MKLYLPIITRRRRHKAAVRRAMSAFTWSGRENGEPIPLRVTCMTCGGALDAPDQWVLYLLWNSHATEHAYEATAAETRR